MKGVLFLDKSQTCHFHAYDEIFKHMKETYSEYIIVLNNPYYKFSDQNLLPIEINKNLFETYFLYNKNNPNNIQILNDIPNDDLWSKNLNKIILDEFKLDGSETDLSNLVEIMFLNVNYLIKYQSKLFSNIQKNFEIEIPEFSIGKIKDTESFFLGTQWADKKTYPSAIPTVDVALVLNLRGFYHLVLGIKKDDPFHHLIGGFVDPTDNSYEDASIRELSEEVNYIANPKELKYLTSEKINDWRYKNLKHNIITHLFLLRYNSQVESEIIARQLKPCDDLEELVITAIDDLDIENVVPHHRNLVKEVLIEIKKRK